jgi:hypothetical protein
MTKVQLLETGNAHLTVSNVAQLGLALQSQRNFRHVQLGQLLLHEEVITRQQYRGTPPSEN